MVARRSFILLLAFVIIFAAIVLRLFWLDVMTVVGFADNRDNLLEKSVEQRRTSVVLDDGRGHITDKYGVSLAGIEVKTLLISPQSLSTDTMLDQRLARILQISFFNRSNLFLK